MLNPILKRAVKYRRTKRKSYYGKQQWTTDSPIVEAVQASLSVGFGKNVKGTDKNDIQLQELSANVLIVLNTMQAENEKSNERLVARLQMENVKTIR